MKKLAIILTAILLAAAFSSRPKPPRRHGPTTRRIASDGKSWTLTTGRVEQVVALEDGRLVLKSLKNQATGRELIPPGTVSDEFAVRLADAEPPVTGAAGPWTLVRADQKRLGQGELQLDLTLHRGPLRVTKSYVVVSRLERHPPMGHAGQRGEQPLRLVEPSFLRMAARLGDPAALDFHWMTGGENQPGSWVLKTEKLNRAKPRTFDSYEPFPAAPPQFPGDGIDAKITLNGKQVWPAKGWQYVPNATVTVPFDFALDVSAGDKLVFLVNMHGNIGWDTTAFDPKIAYADGETHVASQEFSGKQGQNGWRYQYLENGRFVDLVYYPGHKQWRKEKDNATGTPFVGPGDQHPDVGQDAARVWTAPKSGRVRITGSVCNTGNGAGFNNALRVPHGDVDLRPVVRPLGPRHRRRARHRLGLFRPLGVVVSARARRGGDGPTESRRPQADARPRPVARHAQGVRGPLPRRSRRGRQRSARLAVPLPVGLHPRAGWFPAIRMLGYLVPRGPAGGSRASAGPAAGPILPAPSARSSAWPT